MSMRLWCFALLLVALCSSGCCWCHPWHHCGYQAADEDAGAVSPAARLAPPAH